MSDAEDVIQVMSIGAIDPDEEERERELVLAQAQKDLEAEEAPELNSIQGRINNERRIAKRNQNVTTALSNTQGNTLG